jgi:hypothetical protein
LIKFTWDIFIWYFKRKRSEIAYNYRPNEKKKRHFALLSGSTSQPERYFASFEYYSWLRIIWKLWYATGETITMTPISGLTVHQRVVDPRRNFELFWDWLLIGHLARLLVFDWIYSRLYFPPGVNYHLMYCKQYRDGQYERNLQ